MEQIYESSATPPMQPFTDIIPVFKTWLPRMKIQGVVYFDADIISTDTTVVNIHLLNTTANLLNFTWAMFYVGKGHILNSLKNVA